MRVTHRNRFLGSGLKFQKNSLNFKVWKRVFSKQIFQFLNSFHGPAEFHHSLSPLFWTFKLKSIRICLHLVRPFRVAVAGSSLIHFLDCSRRSFRIVWNRISSHKWVRLFTNCPLVIVRWTNLFVLTTVRPNSPPVNRTLFLIEHPSFGTPFNRWNVPRIWATAADDRGVWAASTGHGPRNWTTTCADHAPGTRTTADGPAIWPTRAGPCPAARGKRVP